MVTGSHGAQSPAPSKLTMVLTSSTATKPICYKSQAGTRDLAEVYAEEGTESCAGMTWREQEQLRERQQDAEIAARVLAFTSAPFRIPLPLSRR